MKNNVSDSDKILAARTYFDNNNIPYITVQGGIVLEIQCSRGLIFYKPLSDKFTLVKHITEKGKGIEKVVSLCENNQG